MPGGPFGLQQRGFHINEASSTSGTWRKRLRMCCVRASERACVGVCEGEGACIHTPRGLPDVRVLNTNSIDWIVESADAQKSTSRIFTKAFLRTMRLKVASFAVSEFQ
jgi:hypothetical protein